MPATMDIVQRARCFLYDGDDPISRDRSQPHAALERVACEHHRIADDSLVLFDRQRAQDIGVVEIGTALEGAYHPAPGLGPREQVSCKHLERHVLCARTITRTENAAGRSAGERLESAVA